MERSKCMMVAQTELKTLSLNVWTVYLADRCQLKAIVIDDQCHVVNSVAVNFASELPEFKTENGVHRHSDGRTVTSPVHMWLKAIDMCFTKLTKNVDVARIRAISGCGQVCSVLFL
uniref:FGGY_N domain-containing protein n=1 Tax=Ascaris lumbricoides TaxID=6252 RepID=A0A0M3IBK7_ASCLU